ncbi:helix-turn-helix domain-containing protein [Streptomyces griseus]|uniref:helix-turn-helix domain-containing protein n=1 Tax=Streptomyces griseus TaxID=1911 RepID=UPI00386EAF8D|nr:helix-turn-helix domain-containing protein [Streptomyces fimicarius]
MSGRILALVGQQEQGPPSTPQAAARLVGAVLRHLRVQRRLNLTHVAKAGHGSPATLSRIERALGDQLNEERVFGLLDHYSAPQEVIDEVAILLRQSQGQQWWSNYSDVVGELLASVLAMEATSKVIRIFQEINIPGVLQTAAYARALMAEFARAQHDPEVRRKHQDLIDRRLEMRLMRQRLLDQEDAPIMHIIIAESVLAKEIGGALVMREQLRSLFNVVENKPNAHISILPGNAMRQGSPLHPAMTLFKPYESETGKAVYLENKNRGGEFLVDPTEVETYQASMDDWWERALPKEETLERIQMYIDRLTAEPEPEA